MRSTYGVIDMKLRSNLTYCLQSCGLLIAVYFAKTNLICFAIGKLLERNVILAKYYTMADDVALRNDMNQ